MRKQEDQIGQTSFILKNYQGKTTKALFTDIPKQIKDIEKDLDMRKREFRSYEKYSGGEMQRIESESTRYFEKHQEFLVKLEEEISVTNRVIGDKNAEQTKLEDHVKAIEGRIVDETVAQRGYTDQVADD